MSRSCYTQPPVRWPATQCAWTPCSGNLPPYRNAPAWGTIPEAFPTEPPGDRIMLKVSEILRVKGSTLYTATPDTSIQQAIDCMSEQDIGSLVIMEHGQLVGMLTFREIIRYLHSSGGTVGGYTVRSIMDDAPVSVSPNTGFEEVQRLMLEKHARYMPVMDGPTLMGVISFYDMAQAIVAAQQVEDNIVKAYILRRPTRSEEASFS